MLRLSNVIQSLIQLDNALADDHLRQYVFNAWCFYKLHRDSLFKFITDGNSPTCSINLNIDNSDSNTLCISHKGEQDVFSCDSVASKEEDLHYKLLLTNDLDNEPEKSIIPRSRYSATTIGDEDLFPSNFTAENTLPIILGTDKDDFPGELIRLLLPIEAISTHPEIMAVWNTDNDNKIELEKAIINLNENNCLGPNIILCYVEDKPYFLLRIKGIRRTIININFYGDNSKHTFKNCKKMFINVIKGLFFKERKKNKINEDIEAFIDVLFSKTYQSGFNRIWFSTNFDSFASIVCRTLQAKISATKLKYNNFHIPFGSVEYLSPSSDHHSYDNSSSPSSFSNNYDNLFTDELPFLLNSNRNHMINNCINTFYNPENQNFYQHITPKLSNKIQESSLSEYVRFICKIDPVRFIINQKVLHKIEKNNISDNYNSDIYIGGIKFNFSLPDFSSKLNNEDSIKLTRILKRISSINYAFDNPPRDYAGFCLTCAKKLSPTTLSLHPIIKRVTLPYRHPFTTLGQLVIQEPCLFCNCYLCCSARSNINNFRSMEYLHKNLKNKKKNSLSLEYLFYNSGNTFPVECSKCAEISQVIKKPQSILSIDKDFPSLNDSLIKNNINNNIYDNYVVEKNKPSSPLISPVWNSLSPKSVNSTGISASTTDSLKVKDNMTNNDKTPPNNSTNTQELNIFKLLQISILKKFIIVADSSKQKKCIPSTALVLDQASNELFLTRGPEFPKQTSNKGSCKNNSHRKPLSKTTTYIPCSFHINQQTNNLSASKIPAVQCLSSFAPDYWNHVMNY